MDKNKFILSLLVSLVGLLMLVSPETFIAMVVIILGAAAIADGFFIMVTTRNLILDPQYKLMMTIRGLMSIFVGAISILLPLLVAAIAWKMMAYALAIYLLISAGLEIYGIAKLHRNGIMIKQSVIETIISVLLAVVLFIIPAKTAGGIIVGICGFVLLVSGLISAFLQWKNRPITVVPDFVSTEEDSKEEKSEESSKDETTEE
ncbi:DUF308 domain-containing protein [Treponema pectinovorum]|uniref:DUF308 domain-containing protein n=2 Tax=Treponema pectinovorum TaxID=164 RepID=UPI0011C861E1|nr:DUF308 domain-containing protein [Treponema pectinovorum]